MFFVHALRSFFCVCDMLCNSCQCAHTSTADIFFPRLLGSAACHMQSSQKNPQTYGFADV